MGKPSEKKPIRYGRPCMQGLPPELGRRIINTILNSPPSDDTILKRECARAKRRLAEIAEEIKRNEAATK